MVNKIAESDELIIVDKPHGWLTTPARHKDDPRPVLGLILQEEYKIQIYPVHRLDFEVGGLVMFAKSAQAHRIAQSWFEHGQVVKTYHALSHCLPGQESERGWREWKSKIVRGKKRSFIADHGQTAITHAHFNGELWELRPVTGRPHQLRVEMARHGFPILGDVLYGGKPVEQKNWIALRAIHLEIEAKDRLGLPELISGPSLTREAT